MSRKGDCWDNAVAESFFSHLKRRLTEGTTYQNADSLRQDLFVYSDCYYARYRTHSANSWKTPEQAEREFLDELAPPLTHCLFFLGRAIQRVSQGGLILVLQAHPAIALGRWHGQHP